MKIEHKCSRVPPAVIFQRTRVRDRASCPAQGHEVGPRTFHRKLCFMLFYWPAWVRCSDRSVRTFTQQTGFLSCGVPVFLFRLIFTYVLFVKVHEMIGPFAKRKTMCFKTPLLSGNVGMNPFLPFYGLYCERILQVCLTCAGYRCCRCDTPPWSETPRRTDPSHPWWWGRPAATSSTQGFN